MENETAIQKLFNHFTADLEKQRNIERQFVCPLCLQGFTSTEELSRAHLWPKALGGRIYTLSCGGCNNRIGSEIERHEVERVKAFTAKETGVRLKTPGMNSSVNALFSMNIEKDGEPELTFRNVGNPNYSDPRSLEEYKKGMREGGEIEIELKDKFNPRIAPLTYLHFAYLTLFHWVGYSWIDTEQAERIREQLDKPKESIFNTRYTIIEESVEHLAEANQPLVFETWYANSRHCLIVTPQLSYPVGKRAAVWIPATSGTSYATLPITSGEFMRVNYKATVKREPGSGFLVSRPIP